MGEARKEDPDTKLVICNASVALVVSGIADDLEYGAELAWEVLSSGKLLSVLKQVIRVTGGDPSRLEG
jgi:anthranilate phosphoribosyltransferase